MRTDTIAVIAFNGISPFHLAVPSIVFGEDRRQAGVPLFEVLVCAAESGPLQTSAGFSVQTPYGLGDMVRAGTIIVPSWRNPEEPPHALLLQALRMAQARGARIGAVPRIVCPSGCRDTRRPSSHNSLAVGGGVGASLS